MRHNLRVYEYQFQLQIKFCQITMRFPCTFSLNWKIDKNSVGENRRVSPVNNNVKFNTSLKLSAQVLWSGQARRFLQKKSLLTVNLSSQSKPNEIKVAGVVTLELSKFLNEGEFENVDMLYSLERCPDKNSQICLAVGFKKIKEVRLEDYQDSISLCKIAPELSAIGKTKSIESSEYLDIKELQMRVADQQVEDDAGGSSSKRINSLNRGSARKSVKDKPRISMQPLITQERELLEESGIALRKVRSGERLDYNMGTPIKGSPILQAVKSEGNLMNKVVGFSSRKEIEEDQTYIIESLKQVNDSLDKENDQIKAENTSLRKLNQELSFDMQQLHRRLQKMAKNELDARKQNQLIFLDYNGEIEGLKKQLSVKDLRVEQVLNKCNEKEFHENSKSANQIYELKLRNKQLEQSLSVMQQRVDEYSVRLADHDTLANNYYMMESEYHRLQQQYDHSQQQIWDLTLNSKEKDKQIAQLQRNIYDATQRTSRVHADIGCLEDQNSRLKELIQTLKQDIQNQKAGFMDEFVTLRDMVYESMCREDSTFQIIRLLEDQCLRMSQVLASRAEHIVYFENRLNDLEKEINDLNMARQTSRSIISYSQSESQHHVTKHIEELEIFPVKETDMKFDKEQKSQSEFEIPIQPVAAVNPTKKSDRSFHKYSNTSWAINAVEPAANTNQIDSLEQNQISRLNGLIVTLRARNKQLTDTIESMKEKQDKLDGELQLLRASGLSKKFTDITKESECDDLPNSISELIQRLKQSEKLFCQLNTISHYDSPRKLQDEISCSMLKEKVEIQNKIRQVSVDLQKFKLGMMKTARGTAQVQQFVANIKPLQDKIFDLLSLDRGIIGISPRRHA